MAKTPVNAELINHLMAVSGGAPCDLSCSICGGVKFRLFLDPVKLVIKVACEKCENPVTGFEGEVVLTK